MRNTLELQVVIVLSSGVKDGLCWTQTRLSANLGCICHGSSMQDACLRIVLPSRTVPVFNAICSRNLLYYLPNFQEHGNFLIAPTTGIPSAASLH